MGNKLSDEELLKELNEAGLYTISQLQTSGQAAVHWDNITHKEEYVNSFISLTDTESSYSGKAGYKVIVNPTATGLVFTPDSGDGTDGREIELQNNGTYIQWRYVGDISWTNLVALVDITGDDGYTPIKDIDYFDGTNGVGISSIVRTSGDGSPGTTDTYTITYTDTSTTTFNVYNGANGTNGTDGYTLYVLNYDPTTEGNDGDSWLNYNTWDFFKKAGGLWGSPIGNIKGETGTDGIDGDQWTYSTDNPSDLDAKTYDSFHINTVTNHIWYKAESAITWTDIFTIAGDKYYCTSTDTIDLSTYSVDDTVTLTVPSGMSYSIGQFLVIANSSSLYFIGKVTSYTTTNLEILLRYKLGNSSASSWEVNLAGVIESELNAGWYTITATAGTGTISSRSFTYPSGWSVGAADTIPVTGLSSSTSDLTIKHNTGFNAVDCVVYASDGTKYTKLQIPVSYATMYADLTDVAIQLASFCTLTQALKIYVKLV